MLRYSIYRQNTIDFKNIYTLEVQDQTKNSL